MTTSPSSLRLIVVRHAQSVNNLRALQLPREEYERTLVADPALTPLGVEQAARLGTGLAQHLAETDATSATIRTSPMIRTLQTARPLLVARGCRSLLWRDIHEHGGLYDGVPSLGTAVGRTGLTRAELAKDFPEFIADDTHRDQGWWGRPVETEQEYVARVKAVAETLLRTATSSNPGSLLVLVSHGTFLASLMRELLSTPDEGEAPKYLHHNAAYSELLLDADGPRLVRYDVTDHLTADTLSR